jgi:hypothetical protein
MQMCEMHIVSKCMVGYNRNIVIRLRLRCDTRQIEDATTSLRIPLRNATFRAGCGNAAVNPGLSVYITAGTCRKNLNTVAKIDFRNQFQS